MWTRGYVRKFIGGFLPEATTVGSKTFSQQATHLVGSERQRTRSCCDSIYSPDGLFEWLYVLLMSLCRRTGVVYSQSGPRTPTLSGSAQNGPSNRDKRLANGSGNFFVQNA